MKKLISIILLALALCLTGCKNQRAKYIEKCKEEFVFDYEEKVIAIDTKKIDGYLIVEVYGEKTFATYICNNGEIWNYENQSS